VKLAVVGAGAVGGVVGARLFQAGHDVTLVARPGPHHDAIAARGLVVHAPHGTDVVRVPIATRAPIDVDTVILLAVKTHDVPAALRELALVASPTTPIACLTNGIDAERQASRWFTRVHATCVYTPATFIEPGVVEAWGTPFAGLFDVGCYPDGADALSTQLAAAFERAQLSSRVLVDAMRWKRGKLLFNLTNALEALCGPAARTHALAGALRAEAIRCFEAARLPFATDAESTARRGDFRAGAIAGRTRSGGSTWQSLRRGAAILECEYLNGEIALLGRLHGIPTPLNDAVLREVTRAAAAHVAPGSLAIDELATRVTARGS
jgi:2-dehydropantoate 2-reductase